MKIGIVGCGLNSDYHINFARRYPGLEIVGLVDLDEKKARDCADKYDIKNVFRTIADLVNKENPLVIHIVAPPKTHFVLGKEALEHKCNVLIEKPLCLNAAEARELYDIAERNGVKLCTMHNHFFDPCMVKARNLIKEGRVGRIINVESHYGLNTRIDAFRKYPAPNVIPWIYNMPGGVFHDFMPHPLYVMLPFLGNIEQIEVIEKSFGELPQGISDELRILVKGEKALGTLTFSFAAKPHHHFVRIYGTKMMINVDFNTMTTTIFPLSGLPKAAQKATYNLSASKQLFTATCANVWNFARKKLRPYHGMQTLIHSFYDAVEGRGDMPVSREEGIQVIEVMDSIWPQIKRKELSFDTILPTIDTRVNEDSPLVLVTGAPGFLGRRLVEKLVEKGYRVRALARKLSNTEQLRRANVEIFFGDVGSEESLCAAFEGIDYVIHAAADTGGSEEEGKLSTIKGTENILALCEQYKVKKLVYISSCSVYGVADYRDGQVVSEESSLERFPEKRGPYSHAKLEAENLVTSAMKGSTFPIVCLRPGTIYGPGGDIYTPMMGFSLGRKVFAVIGNGSFILPFVYVDNLVEAIVSTMDNQGCTNKIYNVVDREKVTKKDYMAGLVKKLYPNSFTIYIPFSVLNMMIFFQEKLFQAIKRRPFLTRYRLISSQRPIVYDVSKIIDELAWKPPVSVEAAFDNLITYENGKN
jgi:predicted dehydrogenase/nucleoside-diphosphate-sugar epimerase